MENNCIMNCYRVLYSAASVAAFAGTPFLVNRVKRIEEGFNDYLGLVEPVETGKDLYADSHCFWVHGVSMGESMVAFGFIKELKNAFPGCRILFTTTHPDVYAAAKKKALAEKVAYFPLDSYFSMNRIFQRWKPSGVFVAETDFWPEFSRQCSQRKIPLVLINGRISEKIEKFYTKMPGLANIVFGAYSYFAVQSETDKKRLISLNVPESKIDVLGNMKADLTIAAKPAPDDILAWKGSDKCLVLGSLHPVEYDVFKDLIKNRSEKIIVAPRKLTNAVKWYEDLKKEGVETCLRSDIKQNARVMLLDTMGELASVYAAGNIAFVGGSIDEKVGGHNPLEIIRQNVPLLCGPNCRNFADILNELQNCGGVQIISNGKSAEEAVDLILSSEEKIKSMTESAAKVLQRSMGALKATAEAVKNRFNF